MLLATVVLGGCATGAGTLRAPATGDATATAAAAFLLAGQSAYFAVDIAGNRELAAYLINALDANAERVLSRVEIIAGSLNLSMPGSSAFSGAATGRFPEGGTRFVLWRDRRFRRTVQRSDGDRLVYYQQRDGSLEVAVIERGVILVSNESVADLSRRADPAAAIAPAERPDAETVRIIGSVGMPGGPDLALVMPDPAAVLTGRLGLDIPRFPLKQIVLEAVVTEDRERAAAAPVAVGGDATAPTSPAVSLVLNGTFEFESETEAALFGRLSRVFVLGFVRSLGLDTTNLRDTVEIEVDGAAIVFAGVPLTPEELLGLTYRLSGQES